MAITKFPPNTIALSGPSQTINDVLAGEVLTPGMLVELYSNSGVLNYRKHAATGAVATGHSFALNRSMLNETCGPTPAASTTTPIGDLAEVGVFSPGESVWAIIASGQNIAVGAYLESAGDGTLRVFSSGAKIGQALEAKNAVAQTYIRVAIDT